MSEQDATLDDFVQKTGETGRKSVRWGPKTKTIPDDWKFDSIAHHANKIIYPQRDKPTRFDGDIPWVRIEDLDGVYISEPQDGERYVSRELMDEMNLRSFPEGTLMCSCSTTMGVCAITTRELLSNQTFAGIVARDSINTNYLYYAISDCAEELEQLATGSTISYLSSDKLEGFHIPTPSLEEQRKITTVLYNVDQAIQKTEELINQAERFKLGLAQDLLNDGINDERKVKTDSRFGPIPESWELHPLKDVGKIAGRTAPEKDESECWGGDIPWATPSEITSLEGPTISGTEEHLTEVALEKVSSNLLPPESVLLTTRATIGECAVNTVEMTTNQGFKSLIPGDSLDTWYAYYRLKYEGDYLASLSKGSTFPEVGKDTVENFVIPVPPLEEQKEIGERLKSVDDMVLSYKSNKS